MVETVSRCMGLIEQFAVTDIEFKNHPTICHTVNIGMHAGASTTLT